MKKIYSLIALVAVAVGMNAQQTVKQVTSLEGKFGHKVTLLNAKEGVAQRVSNITPKSDILVTASNISEFEGVYDWAYYRALGEGSEEEGELIFQAVSDTEVSLTGINGPLAITGTADVAAGTITFEEQDLGEVNITNYGLLPTKFVTFSINPVSGSISTDSDKPIVFTLTDTGYDVDQTRAFGIAVYQNDQLLGYLNLACFNEITKPEQDPDWEYVGMVNFTESFFSGTYLTSKTTTSTVKLEKSTTIDGLIRIVNWFPSLKNYLEIDMSDPNNIVVEPQSTGFTDDVDGLTYVASASALWPDELEEGEYVTLEGNTITFPADAMFLCWPNAPEDSKYGTDANKWYYGGENASTLDLPDSLTGVEDIITDKTDINAPAEYYNIQGMKVKNPTPGSIYIVRKGGKVSKMLVK